MGSHRRSPLVNQWVHQLHPLPVNQVGSPRHNRSEYLALYPADNQLLDLQDSRHASLLGNHRVNQHVNRHPSRRLSHHFNQHRNRVGFQHHSQLASLVASLLTSRLEYQQINPVADRLLNLQRCLLVSLHRSPLAIRLGNQAGSLVEIRQDSQLDNQVASQLLNLPVSLAVGHRPSPHEYPQVSRQDCPPTSHLHVQAEFPPLSLPVVPPDSRRLNLVDSH